MKVADFVIPLVGLTPGKKEFYWSVDKEFFEEFGNEEILDADLKVTVVVEKSGSYIGVDCDVDGDVTVTCDRCLSPLTIAVSPKIRLSVKTGGQGASEDMSEDENGREVVVIGSDSAELEMGQVIYDYVCLSLPLKRVHEEGECDPEVTDRLGIGAEPNPQLMEMFGQLKNLKI